MNTKMAFLLNYFVSKDVMGGTDRLVISLAKRLNQEGYGVDLYFPHMPSSDLYHYEKAGVSAKLLDGNLFAEDVLEELKKEKYAVIVTHFFTPYSKYLKLYSRYVKHIISMEHMSRPIEGKNIKRRLKDKLQYFLYAQYVEKIIHCCNYLKEQDIKEYSVAVKEKSVTIYNGIESTRRPRFDKGTEKNSPLKVVCIGRLVREKGFQHAIDALKKLKSENILLDIYGDGNFKAELERLAKGEKGIKFHGYVSNVMDVLNDADVLLLPSYQEAFPFVVLEACSVGTAVIASKVGGIPEMIRDTHEGFLISPQNTDAIVDVFNHILSDRESLISMREHAYANIHNNFAFLSMINGHYDLITGVLEA